MKKYWHKLFKLNSVGILTLLVSHAYAAGYKLEFQSTSVLADAGDAAVVEDAGTNWYNSAGLVYLPQQLVGSAIDIYSRTSFRGSASAPDILGGGSGFAANGKATSWANIGLPALHYSYPFSQRYAFGLSVVPAWGLLENYGEGSVVRYNLTRIYTRTLDIAPSLAVKVNDQWSFGAGPDIHYWYLSQKIAVRTESMTAFDSNNRAEADAWGLGGHIGALFRYDDATRVGLNYRSRIVMNMRGHSNFALNGIANFDTDNFKLNTPLPPTTTLSVYHDMTPWWALMGTVSYDQWTVVRDMHGQNFMGPTGTTGQLVLPQGFQNTVDFSFGTHYKLNEKWLLRGSVKYEQTPTNDQFRDVSFPDGEKLGFNFGARYQTNKHLAFDFIYAHVFTRTVPINITNAYGANVNGTSDQTVDLAGAQVVWSI